MSRIYRSFLRAIWIASLLLAVCGASADAASDPAERGPFNVGVWESSVEDHIALDGTPRPLPLLVWYPTEAEGEADATLKGIIDAPASDAGPFPVIAFSHGYLSFPAQSTFLMEHMATHGFVVAAMGHPDGSQDRGEAFMNRPGDVRAAVEFVVEESAREGALLHGAADGSRMGVMGHSFGGLTTLAALAKQGNPFIAGLAMAPGIRSGDAFDVRDDLPDIIDPIMFMMGEQDVLARYPDLTAAYAILPEFTERYAFIFPNGGHFAYSDGCLILCEQGSLDRALGHQLINTYGTAFMQVYVGGQNDFDAYLQPAEDIAGGEARLIRGALALPFPVPMLDGLGVGLLAVALLAVAVAVLRKRRPASGLPGWWSAS